MARHTGPLETSIVCVLKLQHGEHCTWWLQYSPALAQAPMANAALKSATISVVGEDPGAWAVPEGVSIAQATMQTAGPANATPCATP